ncbi:hypothetical protein PIB30_051008 [Stylosanthes scabra]|uniref:Uncharacterized protein n=1 Tax=Stylosanthes scabra TaxID=79078 RepID=A0ABU6UL62_9FABA|nr:hypothetical protein [Stylosanthes scabra]
MGLERGLGLRTYDLGEREIREKKGSRPPLPPPLLERSHHHRSSTSTASPASFSSSSVSLGPNLPPSSYASVHVVVSFTGSTSSVAQASSIAGKRKETTPRDVAALTISAPPPVSRRRSPTPILPFASSLTHQTISLFYSVTLSAPPPSPCFAQASSVASPLTAIFTGRTALRRSFSIFNSSLQLFHHFQSSFIFF